MQNFIPRSRYFRALSESSATARVFLSVTGISETHIIENESKQKLNVADKFSLSAERVPSGSGIVLSSFV